MGAHRVIIHVDKKVRFEPLQTALINGGFKLTRADDGTFRLTVAARSKQICCKCNQPATFRHDGQLYCSRHYIRMVQENA